MKKLIALLLALVMVIGLVACGKTTPDAPAADDPTDPPATDAPTEPAATDPAPTEPAHVPMSYDEFVAAPMDTEVHVHTYVQATESWWDNKIQLYTQNEEGAYYIYDVACSEEEAALLVPGTHLCVTGYKGEWSGEVEILDATYEILEGSYIVENAINATSLAAEGNDSLATLMNHLVAINGLTVVASTDANGNEVPFLYKWDGSGSQGDDLYFNVAIGEQVYTFTVNVYMIGTGADSTVYKTIESMQIGDTIHVKGFLYWYNGAQPHITSVTIAPTE